MSSIPDNREIYDTSWDAWIGMKTFGPASRWLRALILDACKKLPPDLRTIHDIGCGEGTNTVLLAARFPNANVRGSDFSVAAIRAASRFAQPPRLEFTFDADNDALDTPAELATCFEVLEHVEQWQEFLARVARSAERYLLLSTPTGRMRPFEVHVGHLRNFQRGELEQHLQALGWHPLSIAYAGFPFYSPIYRDLCQLTNAGQTEFSRGDYGYLKRALCAAVYASFRYCSLQSRHGDQFVGLFTRQ
jgi:SAM-dependent methyltransferase